MTHDKPAKFNPSDLASNMLAGDFEMLATLNETDLGIICFDFDSDWERHDADELIVVLSGCVDLYIEGSSDPTELTTGDTAVVPRNAWHRQEPKPEVSLMFATASSTTEHRTQEQMNAAHADTAGPK